MILAILKNKKIILTQSDLLRILMGLVFITAGLFRIFYGFEAVQELRLLNLPSFLACPLIVLEIIGGLLLIFNKYLKIVLVVLIIFLIGALLNAIFLNGINLFYQAGELFVFNLTPTDFFLHFVFLIILISLLIGRKNSE
ncbi:MAG: DoxX family protein [Patescibacteria group bacterium]